MTHLCGYLRGGDSSGCAVECVGRAESYMICDEQLGRLQNNGGMVFACQLSVVGWCN